LEAGYKWKNKIKMDLKEIGYGNAEWTYVRLLGFHERHFMEQLSEEDFMWYVALLHSLLSLLSNAVTLSGNSVWASADRRCNADGKVIHVFQGPAQFLCLILLRLRRNILEKSGEEKVKDVVTRRRERI
jgi:hypothetical protein